MENTQLSSKNNLFTGNIYQNNDTWINTLDETKFLNKVLKMVVFQLFCPSPVYAYIYIYFFLILIYNNIYIYVYLYILHIYSHYMVWVACTGQVYFHIYWPIEPLTRRMHTVHIVCCI